MRLAILQLTTLHFGTGTFKVVCSFPKYCKNTKQTKFDLLMRVCLNVFVQRHTYVYVFVLGRYALKHMKMVLLIVHLAKSMSQNEVYEFKIRYGICDQLHNLLEFRLKYVSHIELTMWNVTFSLLCILPTKYNCVTDTRDESYCKNMKLNIHFTWKRYYHWKQ